MTKESTKFEKGDVILYTDPPYGHFIPPKFTATVVSCDDTLVKIDCGNDVQTGLVKDFCRKISKPEQFKLKLEGVFIVKPSE